MCENVESIVTPAIKGVARFTDGGDIQVEDRFGNKNAYDSIQVFANHWRFIEDQPKDLLKPAVIVFIKNYLALNDINLDVVEYIEFDKYFKTIDCVIKTAKYNLHVEIMYNLIDFNIIDDEQEYTLEELGIK